MLPGIKSHISVFTLPKVDADSSEIKDHTHDKCTPSSGSNEIFLSHRISHRNMKILMITATWKVFPVEGQHPSAVI